MPFPVLVRPNPLPPIAPPTVRVLALTPTVRLAFIVTAPVPRFRLLVPTKVKSPFQFWTLLLVVLARFATELSSAPPLIVSVPVPRAVVRAVVLPSVRVPAFKKVPPS